MPSVGDFGLQIRRTVTTDGETVRDVSGDDVVLRFRKPGGAIREREMTLIGDGTDGRVVYTTIAADWSVAGRWVLSLRGSRAGVQWTSDTFTVDVDP